VKAATSSLAAQLQAMASGAGGGMSVLDAACGVLVAGRSIATDTAVREKQRLSGSPDALQAELILTGVESCTHPYSDMFAALSLCHASIRTCAPRSVELQVAVSLGHCSGCNLFASKIMCSRP